MEKENIWSMEETKEKRKIFEEGKYLVNGGEEGKGGKYMVSGGEEGQLKKIFEEGKNLVRRGKRRKRKRRRKA